MNRFVNKRFLTPLTSEIKTKRFLILDFESKDEASSKRGFTRPFMAGMFDGTSYQSFWNDGDMQEWGDYWKEGNCVDLVMRAILTRPYRGWSIYAHNGGRFDFLFLLPWLMNIGRKLGFEFSILPVSSSIQALDVWRVKKSDAKKEGKKPRRAEWRFLDSYKLIPLSLNDAAKSLDVGTLVNDALKLTFEERPVWLQVLTKDVEASAGLGAKEKIDLDLSETDRVTWSRYNRQDCWLTFAVVSTFHQYIETVLQGEVGITLPATAMKLFRRRFLNAPIARTMRSHAFVRESYCGGRCEDFVKEGRELFIYDINSSYPASMLELMPVGPGVHCTRKELPRFSRQSDQIGFVRCDVEVPPMNIPPLPLKSDGSIKGLPAKLIFPTGRLSGIWEWGELSYALSLGCTLKRHHESWWYRGAHIFEDYVNTLYGYRNQDSPTYDAGLSSVAKGTLVSLYGKFAMRDVRTKIYTATDPDRPEGAVPAYQGEPESELLYHEEHSDADYIIPQISARVTAVGRVKLHKFMRSAELTLRPDNATPGTVYYTDTDSITTDVIMETSTALGDLKLEHPKFAGEIIGTFLGPKLYVLETSRPWHPPLPYFEIVKAKGFEERTRAVIDKISNGDTVWNRKLQKIGGMVRKNFKSGPVMLNVPRTLLGGAGKRVRQPDGSTVAYHVEMWEP